MTATFIVLGLAALELLGWTVGGVILLRMVRRPAAH